MKQTIELHKKWKSDPSKGEVFTPSELVREMLDKIPSDVWENPESKFLDPCMGKGTFIVEIVKRLIDIYGYSKEDAVSRVYGYDTCVKYINYLKRGGLVNVFHKNFLNEELNMKFDVVVGNPPYQENGRIDQANKLWPKMVIKAFELTKENGYLTMITPNGWMNSKTADVGKGKSGIKIYKDIFKKNNLLFVNADSDGIKTKFFNGVGSTFSIFVIQKSTYSGITEFFNYKTGSNNISISNIEDLPKNINNQTISILNKFNNVIGKFNFTDQNHNLNGNEISVSDENHQYGLFHTHKGGGTFWYGELESEHFGKHNVVITLSGKYKAIYTQLGFSNMCVGVSVETEDIAKNILSFLNSKLYQFAVDMNKFSGFNPRQFILGLPKIDTQKEWSDDEIFQFFNLTKDEIEYVQSYDL